MKTHKLLVLILFFSLNAHATKGLIDSNILSSPTGKENASVPNPKINEVVDLNLTDRTNKAMVLQSLNATQEVFDKSDPFANTLRTSYQDNKTIKVRVREFMGTLIILPEGEHIKMFKLGDKDNFSFKPSISPYDDELPSSGMANVKLAGADTSLHIIGTSGNYYTFYLRGDTFESPHNPTMKVIVTDDRVAAKIDARLRREKIKKLRKEEAKEKLAVNDRETKPNDYLEKVSFDPSKLDFEYKIVGGTESIKPYMVYSDGYFTYFRFSESDSVADVTSFPAIYRVADGADVPVNTTAQGSTLRAEGIANNWTLRLGDEWLCIEKIIKNPTPNSKMNSEIKDESESSSMTEEEEEERSKG